MKYSIAVGALAATASAAPGPVEIRQYGYPTTKPIVNAVRQPILLTRASNEC
jgi:hypothetical protein